MKAELLKWWQTMKVKWANNLVYRLNFLLVVIGPTLVFFFIKYNLWSTIYKTRPGAFIQGYDFETMISYQAWVLIVSLLAQSYNGMDLALDIRFGRMSSYLIYPFDFWEFHAASFMARQILQIFICLVTLLGIWFLGFISSPVPLLVLKGFLFCWVVGLFWFAVNYLIGLAAFWLEETWILRVITITVSQFLSGAIIPLELYPQWAVQLLNYTPFPYMTYVPVKIFMGEYTVILPALLTLLFWTVVLGGLNALVWRKGLRMYTAAGM